MPRGLENILALATAMLLFQLSEGLVPESGISAAIAAGMVVGNGRSHVLHEIAEFKEQMTVLLIATLFILLAADIRLSDVIALGYPGLGTVLALMFVVRPLTVFLCTIGTSLNLRDKLFLSWLAPRGIVAAAVSSLFAFELTHAGIAGGDGLKALVFMVIATTVTVQGLSGGLVARLLGVRRGDNSGYLVLGANPLGRHLARRLSQGGEEVVLLDANADECRAAQDEGFQVLVGNALDGATLARVRPDTRIACIGLTANEEVNLEFARKVLAEFRGPQTYVAIEADDAGVTVASAAAAGARVLFGGARHWQDWLASWRHARVEVAWYVRGAGAGDGTLAAPRDVVLPIVLRRGDEITPVDASTRTQEGDRVEFAVAFERRQQGLEWLRAAGWVRVESDD